MNAVDQAREGLRMRALAVRSLAWGLVFAVFVQLAASAYVFFVWDPIEIVVSAPGTEAGTPAHLIAAGIGGLAMILFYLLAGLYFISVLVWIHKAHSNLADSGVTMDHSANWAVGSWFIPIINLIVPFKAMRELWNRSHGESNDLAHVAADDVTAWWTALMIGLMLFGLLLLKFLFNFLTNAILYAPRWAEFGISAFASLLVVGAAILFANIAETITRAQAENPHVGDVFD